MNHCLPSGNATADEKYSAVARNVTGNPGDDAAALTPKTYSNFCFWSCIKSSLSALARALFQGGAAIVFEWPKFRYHNRFNTDPPHAIAVNELDSLALIATLMREPIGSVKTSLARNANHIQQVDHRRDAQVSPRRIARYCKQFIVEQDADYKELLCKDERSRILASYHFGDYVYGMNVFACLDNPNRKRYVLSQSAASVAYFKNLQNGIGNRAIDRSAELVWSETRISDLSLLLRNGNSTLVMFCDLPIGFGERVEVKFLNRVASFPKGPALLAIINKAPLLPVINYCDGHSNRIEIGTQIEPYLICDESLQAGVGRITQELICFFERFFIMYPEQWRYLRNLPVYYL